MYQKSLVVVVLLGLVTWSCKEAEVENFNPETLQTFIAPVELREFGFNCCANSA